MENIVNSQIFRKIQIVIRGKIESRLQGWVLIIFILRWNTVFRAKWQNLARLLFQVVDFKIILKHRILENL